MAETIVSILESKSRDIWTIDPQATVYDAIALMAENPNLIRRPLVMRGHRLVIGYDEQAYKEIVK